MSQLFASGGQSIGISASATGLPLNIQGWFPLGLTCLISLHSKGLSRVFSRTSAIQYILISYLFCLQWCVYVNLNLPIYSAFPPWGFPGSSAGIESACNSGDPGSIPGSGRSPGGGHGNPLQYSCLENPHGWRSMVGCIPWGHKELDTAEGLGTADPLGYCVCFLYLWLYFHFVNRFMCDTICFLDSTFKQYHMMFVIDLLHSVWVCFLFSQSS